MKQQRVSQHSIIIGILSVMFIVMSGVSASAKDLSTWEMIQKRGSIRLGVIQTKPHFIKNPITGAWSGFCVAMTQEIADVMGVELEFVETTWGNVVAALQAGQIDLAPALTPTPKRALAVDFLTHPLIYTAFGVLVRENVDVKTWQDLEMLKIAVIMGTNFDEFLTKRFPNTDIQRYPGGDETIAAFQSGRADGLITSAMGLAHAKNKPARGRLFSPSRSRIEW